MIEFSLSSLTLMWFCEPLNNKSIIDYGVEEKKNERYPARHPGVPHEGSVKGFKIKIDWLSMNACGC